MISEYHHFLENLVLGEKLIILDGKLSVSEEYCDVPLFQTILNFPYSTPLVKPGVAREICSSILKSRLTYIGALNLQLMDSLYTFHNPRYYIIACRNHIYIRYGRKMVRRKVFWLKSLERQKCWRHFIIMAFKFCMPST